MKREHFRLVEAAELITQDLVRSLGRSWRCYITDRDELVVTDSSAFTVSCCLELEFDPEEELPPGALESEWREQELLDDAIYIVFETAQWLLKHEGGRDWPRCSQHDANLMACSGAWVCTSEWTHYVSDVGELPVEA